MILKTILTLKLILQSILRYDDALDIFATHGIGGMVGNILTALFADARVVTFDGTEIAGGWINHNWVQLGYQVADTAAITAYAFVMTMIILVALDYIPGMSLRVSEEGELVGLDEDQIGEWGYDWQHVVAKESMSHSEGASLANTKREADSSDV